MNHKRIFTIFIILLLAAAIPFSFTTTPGPFIGGWLPFPLLYWWILMFINLGFVLWVAREFIKHSKGDE